MQKSDISIISNADDALFFRNRVQYNEINEIYDMFSREGTGH